MIGGRAPHLAHLGQDEMEQAQHRLSIHKSWHNMMSTMPHTPLAAAYHKINQLEDILKRLSDRHTHDEARSHKAPRTGPYTGRHPSGIYFDTLLRTEHRTNEILALREMIEQTKEEALTLQKQPRLST